MSYRFTPEQYLGGLQHGYLGDHNLLDGYYDFCGFAVKEITNTTQRTRKASTNYESLSRLILKNNLFIRPEHLVM